MLTLPPVRWPYREGLTVKGSTNVLLMLRPQNKTNPSWSTVNVVQLMGCCHGNRSAESCCWDGNSSHTPRSSDYSFLKSFTICLQVQTGFDMTFVLSSIFDFLFSLSPSFCDSITFTDFCSFSVYRVSRYVRTEACFLSDPQAGASEALLWDLWHLDL